jgi:hypothetical protein
MRHLRALRICGLGAAAVGLAAFFGVVFAAAFLQQVFFTPVWIAGISLICLGCLLVIAFLAITYRQGRRTAAEATIGFFCVIVGIFFAFALFGDEVGFQLQWLLPTVIVLPGGVAVIVLATLARREGQRWRNRGDD